MALTDDIGYPLLFGLVMAESGGAPVPGETALIAAGALAAQGHLDLAVVIAVAATAAIIGDNIGYLLGRRGGRWLLERPGRFADSRRRVLAFGEPFFARHGPKAVFFGRWILGLRVWASWLAGITHMRWPSFLVWNAAGGISWAVTVGVLAYVVGDGIEALVRDFGIVALVLLAIAGATLVVLRRRRR
ncbi:MAG TPA: DedA family protein [Baekduia sp.]|nr:DedA family protein [Baekduia sp.]